MTSLADQDARQQIRTHLGATLVVEAAAGTGKTTELICRVMALLRQGKTTLARLVAVTFTEKAAGEMKLRLRTEIERARNGAAADERDRLDLALAELEQAHIGTIHGFCAELLRQRPVEARVDPLFETADELQQERLFDEAFDRWFQVALSNPPEGVRRILRRRSRDRDRTGPREALRRAGLLLANQRDFGAPWRRDPFDREEAIDRLLERLGELGSFAKLGGVPDDWGVKSIAEVERFVADLRRREAIIGRDYDGVEQELSALARGRGSNFWKWKGRGTWFGKDIRRDDVFARRAAAKEQLDGVLQRTDADLAACLHEELRSLVAAYDALKTRAGKLDFLDLLLVVRNLLREDHAVRRELQARFTHILVDEFQDTDPLQAEILLLLAADDPEQVDFRAARPVPGKLFVVGDPKQSIYRFRRADAALYETIRRRLVAHGAKLVVLSTSFRGTPSLQRAINAAFAPKMKGSVDGSQAEYVPLLPFRGEPHGRPTFVALPVPRPYSSKSGKIAAYAVDQSLPDAVGAFVDWLIRKSGWTVTERERPNEPVPVEARHVCLLFRRFIAYGQDVTRPYVRALEARRIPHVLVGGRSFHLREEVLAVRNALTAIEWPDDELSVFATLRGPFFAVADDALLAFRHVHRRLHPLKRVDEVQLDELTRPVQESLDVLGRLHIGRNHRPIADTVAQLLDATRAHAGVAQWPTGEQALANLLRVLDLARRHEAAGATSFRAFVQQLEQEAERGAAAEAPVVEEGTDGVRMMTVHKAKGLEFPVVVLVDPTCPTVQQEPSRYIDGVRGLWVTPLAGCAPAELVEHRDEVLRHDAEEAVRLAYVAATRARDLLVVPVVGDEPIEGWLDVFHSVLYPAPRANPAPAPGCPKFGQDSVLERPPSAARFPQRSVRPGMYTGEAGREGRATSIVWWDPRALELDKWEQAGLRQQWILAADEKGTAVEDGHRGHEQWQARRSKLLERGARPTVRVQAVTASESVEVRGGEVAVMVEGTNAAGKPRPRGARFGTLVHAVLAHAALDASKAQLFAIAGTHGQMISAGAAEIEAAVEAAAAAMDHPLIRAARSAGEVRRETPIVLRQQDGLLVEGVLDLAYRVDDEGGTTWVVVDYKTDAEIAGRLMEYENQVRLYVRAVAESTRQRARGVLLRV